jgi:hypothetical protein
MTGEADAEARLRSWLGSEKPYQQLAAEIATWAAGKERGKVLPDNSEFGRDLDVAVGPSTYRASEAVPRDSGRAEHGRWPLPGRVTPASSSPPDGAEVPSGP